MLHNIDATVLFVHDLARCTTFYRDILGLQVVESDADSISFRLGNQYFLLLEVGAAARLLGEDTPLQIEGGPHGLLAAGVADVDTAYAELLAKGVTFRRPPTSQSWGLRTAHFVDPDGHLWEINQPIEATPQAQVSPL